METVKVQIYQYSRKSFVGASAISELSKSDEGDAYCLLSGKESHTNSSTRQKIGSMFLNLEQ
jgi:hypothetical protein